VWLYIPLEALQEAGFDGDDPPSVYRLWPQDSGSLLLRFYEKEPRP
jgi:hypothetical protein